MNISTSFNNTAFTYSSSAVAYGVHVSMGTRSTPEKSSGQLSLSLAARKIMRLRHVAAKLAEAAGDKGEKKLNYESLIIGKMNELVARHSAEIGDADISLSVFETRLHSYYKIA